MAQQHVCISQGLESRLCNVQICSSGDGQLHFSEKPTEPILGCSYNQQVPCLPEMKNGTVCWESACGKPGITLEEGRNFFISLQNVEGELPTPPEQLNIWLESTNTLNENIDKRGGYSNRSPRQFFIGVPVGKCSLMADEATERLKWLLPTDILALSQYRRVSPGFCRISSIS